MEPVNRFGAQRDLVLRGVGFNYDYADDEGPSRDLRTGEALGGKRKSTQIVKLLERSINHQW